jgi:hypothetical protein
MAKNKKIKQKVEQHVAEEEVIVASIVPEIEETVIEEQSVVVEEQVDEVIPTPIVEQVVKEEPKQVLVKEITKQTKPLVCESRHTKMQYAFTQPSLVRHLMINNNF